jgi:hypothetical protein
MIKVLLPIKVVSVANLREHWSKRSARAKTHRSTARLMLTQWGLHPELPVTVMFTRLGPKLLDGDNLQSSCKAARDGVADWLGLDDADPRITWKYGQQQGKAGVYGLIVEVAPTAAQPSLLGAA